MDSKNKNYNYKVMTPYVSKRKNIPQDKYTTENPQITFSKVIYRRYADYEMKYCIVYKGKLSENKKKFHYDINVKHKCHLLYKIYLIPNDDITFSNIKNIKIKYGNCILQNLSGISIKYIYNHGSFMNIFDTMIPGLALPVVAISSEFISVDIEFYDDVNSEIVLGIKYGILSEIESIKFNSLAHEYIKRYYIEDIIQVNKNEKKTIQINKTCQIEGIKFIMIPNDITQNESSNNCSINGFLKTQNDKYPINKFQCVDIIRDQLVERDSSENSIYQTNMSEIYSLNNNDKYSVEKFFTLDKNIYLLNFKHTGLSNHVQPAGHINIKNDDKIVIIPNFTGTLHVIYREINVLRVFSGVMIYAYASGGPGDYFDDNDENNNNKKNFYDDGDEYQEPNDVIEISNHVNNDIINNDINKVIEEMNQIQKFINDETIDVESVNDNENDDNNMDGIDHNYMNDNDMNYKFHDMDMEDHNETYHEIYNLYINKNITIDL